jgi:uncharacterized protein (TIGR03083 family)
MSPTPDHAFDELRFALAEADAVQPPAALGSTVRTRAFEARAAGMPVDAPAPVDPGEAFRRAVAALDGVLASLSAPEWTRPALRGLDVQGLIGHLIGVERGFQRALAATDDAHADDDHVASTDSYATEQQDRNPAETLAAWRDAVAETEELVGSLGPAGSDTGPTVALYGLRLPLSTWFVVRTFELWTHEEDVRRATGRALAAPDPASLRLMTTLAVGFVPAAMARAGRTAEGRSARLVLTGAGGGTWSTWLSPGDLGRALEGPADVRIVADAVDFCRVVANRLAAAAIDADVHGDRALADDILAGVATLALD